MHQHRPPFRKRLLPATIEFVCRYWHYSDIIEDELIGAAIEAAKALANTGKEAAK